MINMNPSNPAEKAFQAVALDSAEERQAYKDDAEQIDAEQEAWEEIGSALGDFSQAASDLADSFDSTTASSSDEGTTVASGEGAEEGTYTFYVEQIAESQESQIDGSAIPSDGTLTLTSSSGETMEIDLSEASSTQDVADAINSSSSNFGVSASVMVDENGEEHLMLSSTETGEENSFSMSYTDEAGNTQAIGTTTNEAQDAELVLGGTTYSYSSNEIDDFIPGVTINLTAASEGQTVTVEVESDVEAITEDANDFVSAYNELYDTFQEVGGNGTGALAGDSVASSMGKELKEATKQEVNGISLSDIGISTDSSGHLVVDEEQLAESIEENPDDVEALFEEIGNDINELVNEYTGSGGAIDVAESSLEKQEEQLYSEMADYQQELQEEYEEYKQQYAAMTMVKTTAENISGLFDESEE